MPIEPPTTPSLAPTRAPTQQQQLAGLQAQLPLLGLLEQQRQQPAPAAAEEAAAAERAHSGAADSSACSRSHQASLREQHTQQGQAGVVFLSNATGSQVYAVLPDSAVFMRRGFTCYRAAASVSGFIQQLLA